MLAVLGRILMSLLTSLLTEAFLKKVIIMALEKVVTRTGTDLDDKLLAAAKEAWEKPAAPK